MPLTRIRRPAGWARWALLLLILLPTRPAQAQRAARAPRLVVFIVIDQFRADYLTRFRDHLAPGGFLRLMENGAHFANAHFSHACSITAPGHATIATGRYPRQHGIVGNDWFQGRPAASKTAVYDPNARILGIEGQAEGRSPRNLIGFGLGDQLRLAHRHARVFTLALKERAAILLGGQRPDGAFWFDVNSGNFVTSDYYLKELPSYVIDFNTHRWVDRFLNGRWDRLLPLAAYDSTWPLNPEWLGTAGGLGPSFPHVMPRPTGKPDKEFYTAVYNSPFGQEATFEMARRLLAIERLGSSDAVDFFGVSLSSFDAAGHIFGPESAEMMDFLLRTDRQMAGFLDLLEQSVGLDRCIVVLTGDHGVNTSPRLAEQIGLGGGRINSANLLRDLNAALGGVAPLPGNRNYVSSLGSPWVQFDPAFMDQDPETRSRVLTTAKSTLLGVPGISTVYTADELSGPAPPETDTQRLLAWRCYMPGRSGELYVDLAPGWSPAGANSPSHSDGSSHSRHVPIVIMGGGMRPGRYFAPADPADIAVTVAALLGIEPPMDAAGRVLHEAIDSEQFVR